MELEQSTPPALTRIEVPGLTHFKSGKVREIFDLGDSLLIVASDRISAFDCILPTGIPEKGAILTQLSAWWFERTHHLIPNHLITVDPERFPDVLHPHHDLLNGRAMIVRKAEPLPIECVVRGYLIGSGWKEYCANSEVSGIRLRAGYRMADRLDEPIFTPSTKAESGHDENITFKDVVAVVGAQLAERLRETSLELYRSAAEYALQRGIIIADTKFEFGLLEGELLLIDEALTPDSSRFWPVESYKPGSSPISFDKQYVRDFLEKISWNKKPPAPALPEDVAARTREKYIQAFEKLTGRRWHQEG